MCIKPASGKADYGLHQCEPERVMQAKDLMVEGPNVFNISAYY